MLAASSTWFLCVLARSSLEWAVEKVPDDPDVVKLAQTVTNGLKRIKMALSAVA